MGGGGSLPRRERNKKEKDSYLQSIGGKINVILCKRERFMENPLLRNDEEKLALGFACMVR